MEMVLSTSSRGSKIGSGEEVNRRYISGKPCRTNWFGRRKCTTEWSFELRGTSCVKSPAPRHRGGEYDQRGFGTMRRHRYWQEISDGLRDGGCSRSGPQSEIRRFGTTVPELEHLRAWLQTEGCTHVSDGKHRFLLEARVQCS